MMKKILSIQLLKIFLIKNTEEDILKNKKKVLLMKKILIRRRIKIIFNTRISKILKHRRDERTFTILSNVLKSKKY
jgi:hypothetical protein